MAPAIRTPGWEAESSSRQRQPSPKFRGGQRCLQGVAVHSRAFPTVYPVGLGRLARGWRIGWWRLWKGGLAEAVELLGAGAAVVSLAVKAVFCVSVELEGAGHARLGDTGPEADAAGGGVGRDFDAAGGVGVDTLGFTIGAGFEAEKGAAAHQSALL